MHVADSSFCMMGAPPLVWPGITQSRKDELSFTWCRSSVWALHGVEVAVEPERNLPHLPLCVYIVKENARSKVEKWSPGRERMKGPGAREGYLECSKCPLLSATEEPLSILLCLHLFFEIEQVVTVESCDPSVSEFNGESSIKWDPKGK